MIFTHHAEPSDGDDYTYETVQGEVPGVSALAGLDPVDDWRRENGELRAALLLALQEWRYVEGVAQRQVATLAKWIIT